MGARRIMSRVHTTAEAVTHRRGGSLALGQAAGHSRALAVARLSDGERIRPVPLCEGEA